MPLHVHLNETQIKISGEVNEKLQSIVQDPSFERIRVDKKNFVNTILDIIPKDELINRYRKALGLPELD